MKKIKVKALILKSAPFFEKDKRLTIFAKEYGKHTVLVRGGNSTKGRWGGQIEPLNMVAMELQKGKSFWYCNESSILQSFSTVRNQWNSLAIALYWMDITMKSLAQGQENNPLLALLEAALTQLSNAKDASSLINWFHMKYLTIEGMKPLHSRRITEEQFCQLFFNYTGKMIQKPNLIGA